MDCDLAVVFCPQELLYQIPQAKIQASDATRKGFA